METVKSADVSQEAPGCRPMAWQQHKQNETNDDGQQKEHEGVTEENSTMSIWEKQREKFCKSLDADRESGKCLEEVEKVYNL